MNKKDLKRLIKEAISEEMGIKNGTKIGNVYIERMWVNQPSSLQPYYKLHGKRVLAVTDGSTGKVTIFFTDNEPSVSQDIDRLALSPGWRK